MASISNELIKIEVSSKGAELQSLYHNTFQQEYMWSGDPAFWGKKSPVLFPIVGGLKNNQYTHNGKTYSLPRHGLARDMEFTLADKTENSLSYLLSSNQETKQVYPFSFEFIITYTILDNKLEIKFTVKNTGDDTMYFSVGAHPAFAVPMVGGTVYEDYFLRFEKKETIGRWPLSGYGMIEQSPFTFLKEENALPLTKALFANDALVFKNLQSESISLVSNKTEHGLTVSYKGFPYMGLWAAKGADFVCIEPWCGIADSVNASGKLGKKEGINLLNAGEVFERSYFIEVF